MKFDRRKSAVAVAGVTLAAALDSGATAALWSQSATLNGVTITSGNLGVANIGSMTWTDASIDGPSAGQNKDITTSISNGTFRIVPGDIITGSQKIDVTLAGDNMTATFNVVNAVTGGALTAASNGVSYTFKVLDKNNNVVVPATAVGATAANVAMTPDTTNKTLDGAADYTLVITATFDKNTPATTNVQAVSTLSNMGVSLQQVRN